MRSDHEWPAHCGVQCQGCLDAQQFVLDVAHQDQPHCVTVPNDRVDCIGNSLTLAPASDWADPLIPHHRRGKQHHHGGDVFHLLSWLLWYFWFYSYSKNPMARTLIAVNLLSHPTELYGDVS